MKKQHGFTLLELLVVIAIIGLLASIVIMATQDARQKGEFGFAAKQLQQIEMAFKLYASDNFSTWPDIYYPHGGTNQIGAYYQLQAIVDGNWCSTCTIPGRRSQVNSDFSGFSDYLTATPNASAQRTFYAYHNYNIPVEPTCSPSNNYEAGVSIRIGQESGPNEVMPLFYYLDEQIDNGDGAVCGKIRARFPSSDPQMYWIMAEDPNDLL